MLVERVRELEYLGNLPNQLVAHDRERVVVVVLGVERGDLLVDKGEALNQLLEAASALLLDRAALDDLCLLAQTGLYSVYDLFVKENRRVHLLHLSLELLNLSKIPLLLFVLVLSYLLDLCIMLSLHLCLQLLQLFVCFFLVHLVSFLDVLQAFLAKGFNFLDRISLKLLHKLFLAVHVLFVLLFLLQVLLLVVLDLFLLLLSDQYQLLIFALKFC